MPIRLNLLAEAQAMEDLRRRDPVKRGILVGIVLVSVLLAYSSSLQVKGMIVKSELSRIEGELASHTNEYQLVLDNQKKLSDYNFRISSLHRLATNRLLHGTLLDAMQKTAMADVQLMRLRSEQNYAYIEAVKPKTNGSRIIPGKPAQVTERIVLTLDARDSGVVPGDQVNTYKQNLAEIPYFKEALGNSNEVRLASLSPPQTGGGGKPFVLFTLECRYPERTR